MNNTNTNTNTNNKAQKAIMRAIAKRQLAKAATLTPHFQHDFQKHFGRIAEIARWQTTMPFSKELGKTTQEILDEFRKA